MPPPYDCQACGACCATAPERNGYVRLYDGDLERLRDSGLPIIESAEQDTDPPETIAKLATKLDPHGHRVCVAFEGGVGGACTCLIYDRRPSVCRMFEMGGLLCRLARQERGLPV
jgi:Fe-S-cluster containining protein